MEDGDDGGYRLFAGDSSFTNVVDQFVTKCDDLIVDGSKDTFTNLLFVRVGALAVIRKLLFAKFGQLVGWLASSRLPE